MRIIKEMLVVSSMGNVVAAFVATWYGWANPFADKIDRLSRAGYMASMTANCSIFGGLGSCALVAFVLRSQSIKHNSSGMNADQAKPPVPLIWKSVWLTAQLSWKSLAIGAAIAAAVPLLMEASNIPVATYNLHTFVSCISVSALYLRTTSNVTTYCRAMASARRPVSVLPVVPVQTPRTLVVEQRPVISSSSKSWRRTFRMAAAVTLPASLSAVVTVQFITIARHIRLDSVKSVFLFTGGCTLLKTALPALAKLFIAKQHVHNVHNTFFMILAPVLHVEIQLRMALLRARAAMPIYAASALVNLLEIAMRIATVALDLAFIHHAKQNIIRKKRALLAHAVSSDSKGKDAILQDQLDEMDVNFEKWRLRHLHICAAEVLGEMAAEYCGIGLVSIYAMVLHNNKSVEMPALTSTTRTASSRGLLGSHLTAWATQMAFEIITDLVAVALELRLGIPILDVLVEDKDKFMRFAIAVVVLHASGLCISSLVATQLNP